MTSFFNHTWVIILFMMLVTFIPRILPFYIMKDKKLPKALDMFLRFVPYAVLGGALIFPGALFAVGDAYLAVVLGLVFAGIYSYIKGGDVIISVVGAIVVTYIVNIL